jgi:predicted ATP-dependent protease
MKSNLLINSLNTNYNNIKNEIENLINLKKLNNENLNKLFNDKNLNNLNNNFSLTTPKKQEKNFFENFLFKKKIRFY